MSQPSSIALGKRPMVYASPISASPFASISSRNLSWTPWKRTPEAPVSDPSTVPEVATSAIPESTTAALASDVPSAAVSADAGVSSVGSGSLPTAQAAELLPQSPANAATPSLEEIITNGTNAGTPLEDILNSPEAVHAAMKVSDLGLVGLDHGALSIFGWTRDALVGMHMVTGLPWYVQATMNRGNKADHQVGYHRRIDNLDPIMSIPTSRPNDKTQYPIPIRQPSIHRLDETIERGQTDTRPSANGCRHPELAGLDEGTRCLAIPSIHPTFGPDAFLLVHVLRTQELCLHPFASVEGRRFLLGYGFDNA
jgi:hypothetical protein